MRFTFTINLNYFLIPAPTFSYFFLVLPHSNPLNFLGSASINNICAVNVKMRNIHANIFLKINFMHVLRSSSSCTFTFFFFLLHPHKPHANIERKFHLEKILMKQFPSPHIHTYHGCSSTVGVS